MHYIKSAGPVIPTALLLLAVWLSGLLFQLVGGGIPGFASLAIYSALLGLFFYFFHWERRFPEIQCDFVENIPGLGWISGSDGKISSMSSSMRDFLKVPLGSLVVEAASIHPEDRYKTLDLWGPHHWSGEFGTHRLQGPDGSYRWFRSAVHPIRDKNGAITSSWGTFIEIEDLKAAEQALRSSEENLRSILDSIPGQIVTADANGVNDYCNRISEVFYGRSFHEINGTGFTRFIHPDDVEAFVADALHRIATATPMDRHCRMLRHDGVYRWFRMRVQPAFDDTGKVVRWYGLHTDIDDEVRALESLQQAQDKLAQASEFAGLAELAASIAHEVNQPLSAAVTNSEACQLWLAADPPNLERARGSADRIVQDAREAANIVSRIRELFAKKAPRKGPTNINEVIEDVVNLVKKKHEKRGLTINLRLDYDIQAIKADRIQIQQLIFNIVRNGVEAMRSNGEEPMSLDIGSRLTGDTVTVEVADNGVGLVDSHKVFEPFYTTKTDGMGMGLSICRSIVDAHDGRLWAQVRPSRGAVFAFELPAGNAVLAQDHDQGEIPHPSDEKLST
jgi:PAS domain S-box-containing protein